MERSHSTPSPPRLSGHRALCSYTRLLRPKPQSCRGIRGNAPHPSTIGVTAPNRNQGRWHAPPLGTICLPCSQHPRSPQRNETVRWPEIVISKYSCGSSIYKGVCLVSLSEQQTSLNKDPCTLARSHQSLRSKPSPHCLFTVSAFSDFFFKQTFAGPTTCSAAVPPPHQSIAGVPAWPLKWEHPVAVGWVQL